ncbi:alpha/beta hydrolase [Rhodococcus triatomae BKS 15-14]|nr:alpha/beta hydrolase [Rhodococcus triatomae BKS 15-14]
MFDVTRLVHLTDPNDPSAVDAVVDRIRAAVDATPHRCALVQPTLDGVRNGGDVLVHLRFATQGEWEGCRAAVESAIGGPDVRHVDGADYVPGSARASWSGSRTGSGAPTVYRTLLLRVDDSAVPDVVERFEREMLRMPPHVTSMLSWQLSRVTAATGASEWTHVWEQSFIDLDGLLGQYMAHPVHWGYVDKWFDPESVEYIVKDRVCHSFCALPSQSPANPKEDGVRRSDLHPDVEAMLAALEAGFPDVTQYPAAELREIIASRRAPLTRTPDMRTARDVVIDGPGGDLVLRVYVPHGDPATRPVIVFAHGGGFVFCSLDSHDEFCRSMAEAVDVVVVAVDYRLAPEHPAPAAMEDVYAAVCWTVANAATYGGDPTRVAVAGDSAGGNLSATVSLAARERGGPAIAAQILLYPVIGDDFETESYQRYGVGYYNTTKAMRWYWEQYAPDGRDSELVIPTRATTLAGLPPAVVVTAELDPPCTEGEEYARRLAADGVPVIEHRFDGLFHGFLTFPQLSLTAPARQELWQLIRRVLDPAFGASGDESSHTHAATGA